MSQGGGGKWATDEETTNFWIQVECPEFMRVWRIALRGRDSNTQKIPLGVSRLGRRTNIQTSHYPSQSYRYVPGKYRAILFWWTLRSNISTIDCTVSRVNNKISVYLICSFMFIPSRLKGNLFLIALKHIICISIEAY